MPALTAAQVRQVVQGALRRDPEAMVVGVRALAQWSGPEALEIGGRRFAVLESQSPLQIREALLRDEDDGRGIVVLTGLREELLGADVIARLARGQLLSVDPWELVAEMFQAPRRDARLPRFRWLADALLEIAPNEDIAPAPSGTLDLDHALKPIVCGRFGFASVRPDARELLEWTLDATRIARLTNAPAAIRTGIEELLRERSGPLAAAVLGAVRGGFGADVVPLGLTLLVLFAEAREETVCLAQARGRMERFTDGTVVTKDVARVWGETALNIVHEIARLEGDKAANRLVTRSDELLKELHADEYAHLSGISFRGFEIRLQMFADCMAKRLAGEESGPGAEIEELAAAIRQHEEASRHFQDRAQRATMALRLFRWVETVRARYVDGETFERAVREYQEVGCFADWARQAVAGGDTNPVVAAAYDQLLEEAKRLRERENRAFGRLAASWSADTTAAGRDVLPIEQVLDRVVVPLGKASPVLLLVVDGLSLAVFRQFLVGGIESRWVRVAPPGRSDVPAVISTVPTVTEVARTSLFCGRLAHGAAPDEKSGFAAHPGLLTIPGTAQPPILFHKAELLSPNGADLSRDFRTALADPKRRVVAAVINAVDDHLLKGDQLAPSWNVDEVPQLRLTLEVAREARRAVVLVSDHGHVLDRNAKQARQADHDRFRVADGQPNEEYELRVEGPRVVAPGHAVFAAWSEGVRFGGKKNGYHGGIAPQELVVPLAVLRSVDQELPEWADLPIDQPSWWDQASPSPEALETRAPAAPDASRRPAPKTVPNAEVAEADVPAWIEALLTADLFRQQFARMRRMLQSEQDVRTFLSATARRGGTMQLAPLARELGRALPSMNGFVATMQRLLNVEGYGVVSLERASSAVTVNFDLLRQQFGLR